MEVSLLAIALSFLRLGATAFGGPAAHIALMEDELVRRRNWLSHDEFLDLIGAANLIPGPNSTEVAIHIGYKKGGLPGLVTAGICFILPAFAMVSGAAALYLTCASLPATSALLYGLKPVIIVFVFQTLCLLARRALKTWALRFIAIMVAALYLLGVNVVALLFGSGLIAAVWHFARNKEGRENQVMIALAAVSASLVAGASWLASCTPKDLPYSSAALFLYFLKVGSVVYGSGYVLLAFLRSDLVEHYHWLTSSQILDATAVGMITPGPVFTTATFIGYILGGPVGGLLATVGIFLPAFGLVALSGPLVRRMRTAQLAGQFLDAVNAASLALIACVLWQLGQAAFVDVPAVIIAVMGGFALFRFRVNALWLMLGGAVFGLCAHGR